MKDLESELINQYVKKVEEIGYDFQMEIIEVL